MEPFNVDRALFTLNDILTQLNLALEYEQTKVTQDQLVRFFKFIVKMRQYHITADWLDNAYTNSPYCQWYQPLKHILFRKMQYCLDNTKGFTRNLDLFKKYLKQQGITNDSGETC